MILIRDEIIHLKGLGAMSARSYAQAYVCEVSSKDNRGVNCSLYMIFFSCGILTVTVLGSFVLETENIPSSCWRLVVGSLAVVSAVCLLGVLFIHDSPEWYLQKGWTEEAQAAWKFYNPGGRESEFQSYAEIFEQDSMTEK